MEAILKACDAEEYLATPILVLSNRSEAGGLAKAEARGLETIIVDHRPFGEDRQAFEHVMDDALCRADINLIALAGFMRILTPWFLNRWEGRLINIHPSLLPKYTGLNTHQRALESGDLEHGCSVHWVTKNVDEGEVIAQAKVRILPGDTAESLRERVLHEEHKLYPEALNLACKSLLHQKA